VRATTAMIQDYAMSSRSGTPPHWSDRIRAYGRWINAVEVDWDRFLSIVEELHDPDDEYNFPAPDAVRARYEKQAKREGAAPQTNCQHCEDEGAVWVCLVRVENEHGNLVKLARARTERLPEVFGPKTVKRFPKAVPELENVPVPQGDGLCIHAMMPCACPRGQELGKRQRRTGQRYEGAHKDRVSKTRFWQWQRECRALRPERTTEVNDERVRPVVDHGSGIVRAGE